MGAPWGKTALILLGWGYNDQLYQPQTYQADFSSAYVGFERKFSSRLDIKAMVEDVRAWRILGANSAIAQNLRPAGTVQFVPGKIGACRLTVPIRARAVSMCTTQPRTVFRSLTLYPTGASSGTPNPET